MGRAQQMLMEYWAEQDEGRSANFELVAEGAFGFGGRRRRLPTRWH